MQESYIFLQHACTRSSSLTAMFENIISKLLPLYAFFNLFCSYYAAMKLSRPWTRRNTKSMDQSIITFSISFFFPCLFFISTGGCWCIGCLSSKSNQGAMSVKMLGLVSENWKPVIYFICRAWKLQLIEYSSAIILCWQMSIKYLSANIACW